MSIPHVASPPSLQLFQNPHKARVSKFRIAMLHSHNVATFSVPDTLLALLAILTSLSPSAHVVRKPHDQPSSHLLSAPASGGASASHNVGQQRRAHVPPHHTQNLIAFTDIEGQHMLWQNEGVWLLVDFVAALHPLTKSA